MSPPRLSASFDVLGTCFSFDPVINRIQEILDRILSNANSSTKPQNLALTASSLFHTWFYAAQRDFTYLSMCNSYTPIIKVFKATFRRAAFVVGVLGAMEPGVISDEDVDGLMGLLAGQGEGENRLPGRPGLVECFELLINEGWDVLPVTNGGRVGTVRYFEGVGVGIEGEDEKVGNKVVVGLISCDEVPKGEAGGKGDDVFGTTSGEKGVAKPDGRVYAYVNEVLDRKAGAGPDSSSNKTAQSSTTTATDTTTAPKLNTTDPHNQQQPTDRWFVAAHSWDLIAARKAGFRTAWVSHEEGDSCQELYSDFDIYAKDLKECAELMVQIYAGKGGS